MPRLRRLRSKLTYSNVTATLALFLTLSGGTAIALQGSNTVFSDDIKNGEVKNPDIAPSSVGTGKVIDGSLGGGDVAANSLTGQDISEGFLGKVPDASRLDGINSTGYTTGPGMFTYNNVRRTVTGSFENMVSFPGLGSIQARCRGDQAEGIAVGWRLRFHNSSPLNLAVVMHRYNDLFREDESVPPNGNSFEWSADVGDGPGYEDTIWRVFNARSTPSPERSAIFFVNANSNATHCIMSTLALNGG